MRCKFCHFKEYDYSENVELCAIFGYGDDVITENRKGEEGCPYNYATLKRKWDIQLEAIASDP